MSSCQVSRFECSAAGRLSRVQVSTSVLVSVSVVLVVLFVGAESAFGQASIFKTRRSPSSVTLPFVLVGGFEYESDSDQTQMDVPLALQYSFSEIFQASIETAATRIRTHGEDSRTVSGLDDVETNVEYEFLRERRYRPSLAAFGGIKWSTSTQPDIGTPGTEYSAGLVATKEFDFFELDLNAIYTFSGDPELQDILEIPFAFDVPLNHFFSIALEIAPTVDMGGGGEGSAQTEYTLGALWRASEFSTIEGGVVVRNESSWQVLCGWEYSFAGED